MNEEIQKAFESVNQRLDAVDGVFGDFHSLLNNHMKEYTTKFDELKSKVNSLEIKVDTYKLLITVAIALVCVSLAGFVTLAVWAIRALARIGG